MGHHVGWLITLIGVVGCAEMSQPLPQPVEVKGRVILPNGTPVMRGSVAFFPANDGAGAETFTTLTSQGTYVLRVHPGQYRVAIEPEWVRAATPAGSTVIPRLYWTTAKSTLTAEIPRRDAEGVDFQLK